jgi:hypothetical protein
MNCGDYFRKVKSYSDDIDREIDSIEKANSKR